jgi:hypothetical protein
MQLNELIYFKRVSAKNPINEPNAARNAVAQSLPAIFSPDKTPENG